jgi:hypothetical protein
LDTIQCINFLGTTNEEFILILFEVHGSDRTLYDMPECRDASLKVNPIDKKVTGNITHTNALISRISAFMRMNNHPSNKMSYKRICRIIDRLTSSS